MKPRLLDLFAGAGGAARGYQLAGFHVTGVDNRPQPHYCGDAFHEADAMTFPLDGYDAIHASPVCKAHTKTGWAYHFGYHANHADLLTPTRERLETQPAPWIIENVPGAPMRVDMMLCGSQFGLGVRRHRWFEFGNWTTFSLMAPCSHTERVVSPHGHPNRFKGTARQWATAMGIDWTVDGDELAQAIPPEYTRYVGERLMLHVQAAVA